MYVKFTHQFIIDVPDDKVVLIRVTAPVHWMCMAILNFRWIFTIHNTKTFNFDHFL